MSTQSVICSPSTIISLWRKSWPFNTKNLNFLHTMLHCPTYQVPGYSLGDKIFYAYVDLSDIFVSTYSAVRLDDCIDFLQVWDIFKIFVKNHCCRIYFEIILKEYLYTIPQLNISSFSHPGLPGEIYMRLLKMTILPLVISTIITGMTVRSTMCYG